MRQKRAETARGRNGKSKRRELTKSTKLSPGAKLENQVKRIEIGL
jgi:hypothetical protein